MEIIFIICVPLVLFLIFYNLPKQQDKVYNSLDLFIKDSNKIISFISNKTDAEKVNILVSLHQIRNYIFRISDNCDLNNFKKTMAQHIDICDKILLALIPHSSGASGTNDYLNISSKIWVFTYRAYAYRFAQDFGKKQNLDNNFSEATDEKSYILENIVLKIWKELIDSLENGISNMKSEELMLPTINISCMSKENISDEENIMPSSKQLYLTPDFNNGKMIKHKKNTSPIVEEYIKSILNAQTFLKSQYEKYINSTQ